MYPYRDHPNSASGVIFAQYKAFSIDFGILMSEKSKLVLKYSLIPNSFQMKLIDMTGGQCKVKFNFILRERSNVHFKCTFNV